MARAQVWAALDAALRGSAYIVHDLSDFGVDVELLSDETSQPEPGQLVDIWRKPATKDESGRRGPATVLSVGVLRAVIHHPLRSNGRAASCR